MSNASALLTAFERMRARLVDRLLELRGSFDPGLARCDQTSARAQLAAMVAHLGTFIATSDATLHRGFVRSNLAQRTREAGGVAAAISTLVAVGDIAARVAQEYLGDEGLPLAITITQRTAVTARLCSDLLADEVSRRIAQRRNELGHAV